MGLPSAFGVGMRGAEQADAPPARFSPTFRAKTILESERYFVLDRLEQYYRCTQHDWKAHDFEGRARSPGPPTGMPYLSREKAAWYVPLAARAPSSPYRLAKLIVESFTALLFGEDHWPKFEVLGDDDAADYCEALSEAAELPARMIEARGLGGAEGTVGVSWCFIGGQPRVEVHNAKHLFVHEWKDRQQLVPLAVSEVYRYPLLEWDEQKAAFVTNYYWHHRYWDEVQDVHFVPVKFKPREEPVWTPDPDASLVHNDGECHLVWLQNMPGQEIDGYSDYDGLLDSFDTIDVLCSVLARGATLNLDPTLVLNVPPGMLERGFIRKGSDNALAVGEGGDAKYLELAGTSLEAGVKLFDSKRQAVLDAAQCVLADPDKVAAGSVSSVALKIIYKPMLAKGTVLRTQYGRGLRRLLLAMLRAVRRRPEQQLLLPPKLSDEDPDEEGGEPELVERQPGTSENLRLKWPPWFEATPEDRAKAVETLTKATGGKAVLSPQSAVEEFARVMGRDPDAEWKRVEAYEQDELEAAAGAFADADAGGQQVMVQKRLPDEGRIMVAGSAGAPGKGGGAGQQQVIEQGGGGDGAGGFSPAGP